MHVTSKGQVTIPQVVRESMGITPAETEVDFIQDEKGCWYLTKAKPKKEKISRFRTAYQTAKITMSTEEILALTRT